MNKVEINFTEEELIFLQKQAAKHELSVTDEVRIRMGFTAQDK